MEDTARRQYTEIMKAQHQNFDVELCGLFVRPDEPHLGASPDGIANCTCCGKVTVEIKCPYKYRDGLTGSSEDTQFCLDKALQLKKNHEYYHQVQLHMFVCNTQYCDLWFGQSNILPSTASAEMTKFCKQSCLKLKCSSNRAFYLSC